MGKEPIDWESKAYELGFKYDDKAMLKALYPTKHLAELALILGVSPKVLSERMDELGIKRRVRGDRLPSKPRNKPGPRLPGNK